MDVVIEHNYLKEAFKLLNEKYDKLIWEIRSIHEENNIVKTELKKLKKDLKHSKGWPADENKSSKTVVNYFKDRIILYILVVLLIIIGVSGKIFLFNSHEEKSKDWDAELSENSTLVLYTRADWNALPSREKPIPLTENPPHYVIIGHTAGHNCSTFKLCSQIMRNIQVDHMGRGWGDIGFNFVVAGDGAAYTGLGWGIKGAHTIPFNRRSIIISFMGNFMLTLPPHRQINAAKLLIEEGLLLNKIHAHYKLFAHKQVTGTESPGEALIQDVKTWPHWSTFEESDE